MILYVPTKTSLALPETEVCWTYGIRVLQLDSESCEELFSYPDVSVNDVAVNHLCFLCNKGRLDPIHFPDVLEDFLS